MWSVPALFILGRCSVAEMSGTLLDGQYQDESEVVRGPAMARMVPVGHAKKGEPMSAGTVRVSEEPYWQSEDIDVRDVLVAAYQRPLREDKLVRIAREGWDRLKVGAIIISRREDGSYYVIDGQHRIVMINRFGGSVPFVQRVVVWYGLSPEQESFMFDGTQDPLTRSPLRPDERHVSKAFRRDEQALRLDHVVEANGFHIGPGRPGEDSKRLDAVKTLYQVDQRYGTGVLNQALQLITAAWGTEYAPNGSLISGFSKFIAMFPDANRDSLSRLLAKKQMRYWFEDADRAGRALPGKAFRAVTDRVVRQLWFDYNTTHSKYPLPPIEDALVQHSDFLRSQASKATHAALRSRRAVNQ